MAFTTASRTVSFEIEDDARFLALLDSESHATDNATFKPGNQTLYERLEHETKARAIEYDGHFGAQVMFIIAEEDFTPENLTEIEAVINLHLDWCQTLEVVEHVRARRAS